ncbi:MAG: DMT family transporter [Chitinophagaceae bacterium]|nr:DMT family transporter [Chitinophagaceae bacterium]
MKRTQLYNQGFLWAVLGTILFSTKAIFIKLCFKSTDIDASSLLMLRMLFSLPFYAAAMWYYFANQQIKKVKASTYFAACLIGLLGYYMSSLFDFIGLQYVSASIERIILFIYPTLAVLLNLLIFKVAITKKQWLAILITYLGIGLAYWGELNQIPDTKMFFFGTWMILLCAITFAFYLVASGKVIPKIGAPQFTSLSMLAASVGIFIHYFVTHRQGIGSIIDMPFLNSSSLFYVIALAIISTVIPSFLMSGGMKRIGSNDLAIITSIGPVSTLFQARWVLNEAFSWEQILGTVFVVIGVLLVKKVGATKTNPDYPNYPSPKG